jgi:hypothetical protein
VLYYAIKFNIGTHQDDSISYVRIRHVGEFKEGKDVRISGDEQAKQYMGFNDRVLFVYDHTNPNNTINEKKRITVVFIRNQRGYK